MDELQAALESIDSPEHLHVCINPLIIIAQNYQVVCCLLTIILILKAAALLTS